MAALITIFIFIGLIIFWIYYERKGKGAHLTSTTPFATLLMPTIGFLLTTMFYFMGRCLITYYSKIDSARDLHNYTHLLGEDFESGLSTLESIFGNLLPEIARGPRLAEALSISSSFISIGLILWVLCLLFLAALYFMIVSKKNVLIKTPKFCAITIFVIMLVVGDFFEYVINCWSSMLFGGDAKGWDFGSLALAVGLVYAMYKHFNKRIKLYYSPSINTNTTDNQQDVSSIQNESEQ